MLDGDQHWFTRDFAFDPHFNAKDVVHAPAMPICPGADQDTQCSPAKQRTDRGGKHQDRANSIEYRIIDQATDDRHGWLLVKQGPDRTGQVFVIFEEERIHTGLRGDGIAHNANIVRQSPVKLGCGAAYMPIGRH